MGRQARPAASDDASATSGAAAPYRLTYLVKQLQEGLRVQLDEITQQFGLTPKQYTALSMLARYPGLSSAGVARLAFVTPQAANEMVTTLERKGFLARSVDQSNRRRLETQLTRSGRTTLAKCNRLVDDLEADVFGGIGAAGQAHLRRLLETSLEEVSAADPAR
jgi:DNA-binding MarR family transcriptional regulator